MSLDPESRPGKGNCDMSVGSFSKDVVFVEGDSGRLQEFVPVSLPTEGEEPTAFVLIQYAPVREGGDVERTEKLYYQQAVERVLDIFENEEEALKAKEAFEGEWQFILDRMEEDLTP